MWAVADPGLWDRSVTGSHSPVVRVEIWADGILLEDNAPILGGAVTDVKVTGVRRSLSVSVPPTKEWLGWLGNDRLELRPFRGVRWSPSHVELCPLGRFPVLPPPRSAPVGALTLTGDDYWSWIEQDSFLAPRASLRGDVVRVADRLMRESLPLFVDYSGATRNGRVPQVVWEGSRHDVIVELLHGAALTAYVDRTGLAVIVDDVAGAAGPVLRDGVGGTVVSVTTDTDYSNVKNAVSVSSTVTDVTFPPVIKTVWDIHHPANRVKIGQRSVALTSPIVRTVVEAEAFADARLAVLSAPARKLTVVCVPDPRRDAGDVIQVSTPFGTETVMVQQVTHPLDDSPQTVTTGAVMLP